MVARRPLVLISGLLSELPSGDLALAGTSSLEVTAGSGLTGGGFISSAPTYNIRLAAQSSGLIFADDALALDGVALARASVAEASGNDAAFVSSSALASGNQALSNSVAALASGNSALQIVSPLAGGGSKVDFVAATSIPAGVPVGFNNAGQVEPLRAPYFCYPIESGVLGSGGYWVQPTGVVNPYYPVRANRLSSNYLSILYDEKYEDFIAFYNSSYATLQTFDAGPNGYIKARNNATFVQNIYGQAYPSLAYNHDDDCYVWFGQYGNNTYPYIGIFKRDEDRLYSYPVSTVVESVVGNYNNVNYLASGVFLTTYTNGSNGRCRAVFAKGYTQINSSSNSSLFTTGVANYISAVKHRQQNRTVVFFAGPSSYLNVVTIDVDLNTLDITVGPQQQLTTSAIIYTDAVYMEDEDAYAVYGRYGSRGQCFKVKETAPNTFSIVGSGQITASNPAYTVLDYDPLNRVFGYSNSENSRPVAGYFQPSGVNFTPATSGRLLNDTTNTYTDCAFHKATGQFYVFYTMNGSLQVSVLPSFQSDFNSLPTCNNYSNFVGIANDTVISGELCTVLLPGETYTYPSGSFIPGRPLYLDTVTSGLRSEPYPAVSWSGQIPWSSVALATSASGFVLLNQL